MSDEDLIGYLFDLLDPNDRAAVAARVETDSEVATRLEKLRLAAAPLLANVEAEREDPPAPRSGLSVRAIAKVAQHVVEHEPHAPEPANTEPAVAAFLRDYASDGPVEFDFEPGTRAKRPAPPSGDGPDPQSGRRFRADVVVAAAIAFLAFGLVFTGIAKARQQQRLYACQDNLRKLYTGLAGYADRDPRGSYPQIGTTAHPTADAFAKSLTDLDYLPAGARTGCPASANAAAYSYTLGFRDPNGELLGLRRPDATTPAGDEHDLMPLAADFPTARAAPGAGPLSPHAGRMNVLFVGGNVRLTTSPNIGPNGDHIYCNLHGDVGAGINRTDAVLGRPGDKP